MQEIYFDNSSTTIVSPAAAEAVYKVMREDYGNPSSMHAKGVQAEKYVKEAADAIARILKVSPKEIYFTSGGTEANNWAIIGGARAMKRAGNKIITTQMEHPAVSEPLRVLESEGFEVIRIPVNEKGLVDMGALEEALDDRVILISMMYVNNEIGAVTPVEEIGRLKMRMVPKALYHVDAIQAFGKYRIYPRNLSIDLLSVSGHKLHGPKGTGFLYKSDKVRILPLLYGGGQMLALRSGTENVPGIAGLGVASREAYTDFDAKVAHMRNLRDRMTAGLAGMEGVVIHGMEGEAGAPHIVNAAFVGVGSEVLLHALEERGIYVSAGSACSTHKKSGSPTLTAIGAPKEEMESSVRFSFSELNTEDEVDEALRVLAELVPMLRRYRRK
ncbi:MAG: cysteine desulfurase family protein [Lachnospiraceae bacterium]|nr:cysteine desulfurase family protein [Lachnospiraceae bacterium]